MGDFSIVNFVGVYAVPNTHQEWSLSIIYHQIVLKLPKPL